MVISTSGKHGPKPKSVPEEKPAKWVKDAAQRQVMDLKNGWLSVTNEWSENRWEWRAYRKGIGAVGTADTEADAKHEAARVYISWEKSEDEQDRSGKS
jgi:hypothetical protein